MSLEAIKTISEVEDETRQRKVQASAEAKKAVSEAESAGRASIEQARAKAGAEIRELTRKAEEKAKEQAMDLASSTENRMASMRVRAENNLERAADLIVERIVNS